MSLSHSLSGKVLMIELPVGRLDLCLPLASVVCGILYILELTPISLTVLSNSAFCLLVILICFPTYVEATLLINKRPQIEL